MNEPLNQFGKARFDYYSRKLAELGVQQGIVLKSIEESIRRHLITYLTTLHNKNTYIASIIGKNEKTVRNLKNKFSKEKVVLSRNRAYHVAYIVHEATIDDEGRWSSFDTIFDQYLDTCPDDVDVDERAIREVLSALVYDGTLIEQKQRYTSFYRTSNSVAEQHKRLQVHNNEERLEIVQAIASDFDQTVDYVAENPEAFDRVFFTEFTWEAPADAPANEVNERIRSFMRELAQEYEGKAKDTDSDKTRKYRFIMTLADDQTYSDPGDESSVEGAQA